MAKALALVLAAAALLALLAATALFCHGLAARVQMRRYKQSARPVVPSGGKS